MGRLSERKRGPRRRRTGAELVTNSFEAIDILHGKVEASPEQRASAKRLQNRCDLERARRTLKKPEPEFPEEPEPALVRYYSYLREQHEQELARARDWTAYSEAHPEDFWVDGRETDQ